LEYLKAAAAQFSPRASILEVREYGRGNINDTFLAVPDNPQEKPFILQRLNTRIFRQPELIMGNLRVVSEHLARRLQQDPLPAGRRWETPRVLPAANGRDYWTAPDGAWWRALSFVEGADTFDAIRNAGHAEEVGYALGRFHRLVSGLPPERLADTLPGFHITPLYLRHYDEVRAGIKGAGYPSSPEVDYCLRFIEARRGLAGVLEEAKASGKLAVRVIHGDPKVNNVMLDAATGRAVALVDLDTVKPGLVHYDLGDCLRSGANLLGEETEAWETVHFDADLARALLKGYFCQARDFFTGPDYDFLYNAARLIAFELGLRFCTDYLEGNVYFKVGHPEHNLRRALVQFRLTESIEAQDRKLQSIMRDLLS
jgi:Ser/Thr protein kinase RdoA (MazF antagonist)